MELDNNYINPIDWFNENRSFAEVLSKCDCEVRGNQLYVNNESCALIMAWQLVVNGKCVLRKGKSIFVLETGKKYTVFMLYTLINFEGNYIQAINNIVYKDWNCEIPYIRVGVDYFKVIRKRDRYGVLREELKGWTRGTIMDDLSKQSLSKAARFDDFTIEPDNVNYKSVIDNCYNLYRRFDWKPVDFEVTLDMMPYSNNVMNHIFGEQVEVGYKYMKILYEMPKSRFYILCLVSTQRNTGKSTFLNWLEILFGDNFVNTNIEELQSQFNGGYCAKNIIAVEEALSDKKLILEKLKALVLLNKLPVNEKYIRNYSIPFYAKFIFASNHELDFIKIDDEEDRFWVRKVPVLPAKYKDMNILEKLKSEVPVFLKYLKQIPEIISDYRFVLEPREIITENLKLLKLQSKTGLYKDMIERFKKLFWENDGKEYFYCTPTDIQDNFYINQKNNISISYISDVLRKEFKLVPADKPMKYHKFFEDEMNLKTVGRPYYIERKNVLAENEIEVTDNNESPF